MAPTLRVQTLSDLAHVPAYQSDGAAGLDLHAAIAEPVSLAPGAIELIPIGIAIALPPGHEGQVRPRSGLASRFGVTLPNAPGTIDEDYRGEVKVPLINLGRDAFTIEPGMRIAQMVVSPVTHCVIEAVDALDATQRGRGGFGSTGVHSGAATPTT
ncbi:MAG: dUTP diphosphatase [Phycisphaerales bacterium]|jgi:dUTP pyrophosphatase|nr:dUTP diphosphatase [Phycisphaerales bacterium]